MAVLLNLDDSVTTDHISPAGNIARNSPAARYLGSRGSVLSAYYSNPVATAVDIKLCVFFTYLRIILS